MLPPTHIAFTYVAARGVLGSSIDRLSLFLLAFFALLPDMVDKPLYYSFGLFNSGRNVLHNIFVPIIVISAYLVARKRDWGKYVLILFIALSTHVLGDLLQSFIKSLYTDFSDIKDWYTFLVFPLRDPQLLPIKFDPIGLAWEAIFTVIVAFIIYRDGAIHRFLGKDGAVAASASGDG